jgi:hypothetical protein
MSAVLPWTVASAFYPNKIHALLDWVFMTVAFDGIAGPGGEASANR